eukprot:gene9609-biopygen8351
MKKHYRVAVIAPLFLDELVRGESVTFKDKVPDKAAPGLAFYQGVKLAADSLERAGVTMDIDIFDAGSFDQSPEMLIERRRFDSADLIIGAVEQHDIPVLATFAKKKKINFVSALINYDGWVKDNQYFTMLQPSLKSHCMYKNLTVNVTYPFDFSHVESAVMGSVNTVYGKEFGGVPTEMMWRGYEAMMWYGNLLKSYGTIFNDSYKDLSGAPFTKFRIKPRWDRNGNLLYFENKNIYLTTYQGGAHHTK